MQRATTHYNTSSNARELRGVMQLNEYMLVDERVPEIST